MLYATNKNWRPRVANVHIDTLLQTITFIIAGLVMIWRVSRIATSVELRIEHLERSLARYLERLDDVVQRLARLEGRSYTHPSSSVEEP